MNVGTGPRRPIGRPPRLAERLATRLLPREDRDEILGDLAENHAWRARRSGSLRAGLRYAMQAVSVPARLRWRRLQRIRPDLGELRHVIRGLLASPGFTAVALLSLALGIGANTAILSAVRSVLYEKLPVDRPDELAFVYRTTPPTAGVSNYNSSSAEDPVSGEALASNVSMPIYESLQQAAAPSLPLAAFGFARGLSVVAGDAPAIPASGLMASGNFFSTLGLSAALGRPLTPGDDLASAPSVVVISHKFWQGALGGDPEVVGRSIRVNGAPYQIVGVTPPEFVGLSPGGFFEPTDITVPLVRQPAIQARWGDLRGSETVYWLRLLTRLPAGTEAAPVRDAISAQIRQAMLDSGALAEPADADDVRAVLLPAARGLDSLRRTVERPLNILTGVVAVVLLIACANLASLMLARGASRRHEISVRQALGATRARLVAQLLMESLVLALAGGALGLLLAVRSGAALTAALTAGIGRVDIAFELDGGVLAIALGTSLGAALLAGLLPALRLTRSIPGTLPRARAGGDGGRSTLGRFLVAGQIAVSIPLIVGAGLFLRTAANLAAIDPGFDPRGLMLFRVDPTTVVDGEPEAAALFDRLVQRLEELPQVSSVTLLENALISGWISNTYVDIEGEQAVMQMNAVGTRFIETLGIPLVAGRSFDGNEPSGAPAVALVNEVAARELFGGSAVGRSFRIGEREIEVVGVLADSRYSSLRYEAEPTFYDPYQQRSAARPLHVVLRFTGPAGALDGSVREAVASVDRNLPVTDLRTQEDLLRADTSRERVFMRLLGLFGVFALLIACIGLHGVTSFAVAGRRGEIGIRLAIGATPRQVLRMVLRQVVVLALVGVVFGLAVAWWLGPVVESLLYGLEPADPTVLLATVATLLAVALIAGWLPARRAARTDAVAALSRQ